jgi:hypothetical protein
MIVRYGGWVWVAALAGVDRAEALTGLDESNRSLGRVCLAPLRSRIVGSTRCCIPWPRVDPVDTMPR